MKLHMLLGDEESDEFRRKKRINGRMQEIDTDY